MLLGFVRIERVLSNKFFYKIRIGSTTDNKSCHLERCTPEGFVPNQMVSSSIIPETFFVCIMKNDGICSLSTFQ